MLYSNSDGSRPLMQAIYQVYSYKKCAHQHTWKFVWNFHVRKLYPKNYLLTFDNLKKKHTHTESKISSSTVMLSLLTLSQWAHKQLLVHLYQLALNVNLPNRPTDISGKLQLASFNN